MGDGDVNAFLAFLKAMFGAFGGKGAPAPAPGPVEPPEASVAASQGLLKPSAFYAALRVGKLLGPVLTQSEVEGCAAIVQACKGLPLSHAAYALATAYHETAHSMQPVKELGGEAYFHRMYDIDGNRPDVAGRLGNLSPGDGVRYAGRGYVQLTGRRNYTKTGKLLEVDLIGSPDLAMRPDIAAKVMRRGMVEGWFTGKTFDAYLTSEATAGQFESARRIINGTDKAVLIAGYAVQFQDALRAGSWK